MHLMGSLCFFVEKDMVATSLSDWRVGKIGYILKMFISEEETIWYKCREMK